MDVAAFSEHGSFKQSVINILVLFRGTEGLINTFQIFSLTRDKKLVCICWIKTINYLFCFFPAPWQRGEMCTDSLCLKMLELE